MHDMEKYVIISPVRNEADFIETTIQSVLGQTILPEEYILVNDGSTDGTDEIIDHYTRQHSWIRKINRTNPVHQPGAGVVAAFYAGFDQIKTKDWDYVIKLDGDLKFETDYFEQQILRFRNNPKLGITSGKTYQPRGDRLVLDRMPDDHTRGPAKMYKRTCWEQIGGIDPVLGWDTLDELKAQVRNWETRSFPEIVLIHYKPIGYKQKNIIKREWKAGERLHFLGYYWPFVLARGCYHMLQKPYWVAGMLNILGFIKAEIANSEQIPDRSIIRHLRKKQKQRLTGKRKLIG
jgi:glycosyltransferase involved in cell wall biosynthesis